MLAVAGGITFAEGDGVGVWRISWVTEKAGAAVAVADLSGGAIG